MLWDAHTSLLHSFIHSFIHATDIYAARYWEDSGDQDRKNALLSWGLYSSRPQVHPHRSKYKKEEFLGGAHATENKKQADVVFGFVFWPHHAACGILVPQPRMEPTPPCSGSGGVLNTRTPGKSQADVVLIRL